MDQEKDHVDFIVDEVISARPVFVPLKHEKLPEVYIDAWGNRAMRVPGERVAQLEEMLDKALENARSWFVKVTIPATLHFPPRHKYFGPWEQQGDYLKYLEAKMAQRQGRVLTMTSIEEGGDLAFHAHPAAEVEEMQGYQLALILNRELKEARKDPDFVGNAGLETPNLVEGDRSGEDPPEA